MLPARLPNLLLNGSSGIAVGMATNIPPHNLRELAAAIIYLIDNYDTIDDITVEELMKFVPGPDFPTGGIIVGREGISRPTPPAAGAWSCAAWPTSKRCTASRQHAIIITEIPYQVNKTSLIERIAELVREDKIDQISDLRDESDRRGMSIVIELKRGAQPKKVLNQLYKYTALQSTFGVQMLALVDGEPRTAVAQAGAADLHRAPPDGHHPPLAVRTGKSPRPRAHPGRAADRAGNLDEVIKTIRESPDADEAKTNLMKRFKLSELQAQAILDMQLRRLAALERQKIEDEHKQVREHIAYLEDLLAHPKKILALIQIRPERARREIRRRTPHAHRRRSHGGAQRRRPGPG